MQKINQKIINEFLDKKNVFAVVGASKDTKKYGSKVYLDLKNAGYVVYPINPNAKKIWGEKCYSNLRNLPVLPDVVDIVVPPKVTKDIIKECKDLGINKIWMQPGSESEDTIKFCDDNNITVLYGICVMLERKKEKKSG